MGKGVIMGFFQDVYYKMENGWYALLDKMDKAGIPVYKVIDPIDKVVPSFVLILILLGLVVLGLLTYIFFAFGIAQPGDPVTVYFLDTQGNPVTGANVDLALNGKDITSMKTSNAGVISFQAYEDDLATLKVTLGNDTQTEDLIITKERQYRINLSFALAKDTINFTVGTVNGEALKEFSMDFWCSNSNITPPDSIRNTTAMDYKLDVDPECGNLTVDVKSSYYEEVYGETLNNNYNILLTPLNYGGNGSLILSVYDNENLPVAGYNVTLSQNGIPLGTQSSLGSNTVSFLGLASASYTISFSKSGYLSKTETVNVNGTQNYNMTVEKDLLGQTGNLKVTVVNSSNKQLAGAKIIVYNLNSDSTKKDIAGTQYTDSNGSASIVIPDAGLNYWINISLSDYITKNIKSQPGNQSLLVALVENGKTRRAVIKVIDDQNNAVNNAMVALYDEKDNVVDPNFGLTDSNGIANDKSLEDGFQYKPYVYKGAYNGYGTLFTFNLSSLPSSGYDNLVTLTLPRTAWELTLVDKFNQVVPNALVELYDAYNDSPIEVGLKFASPQGVFSVSNLRADRKYFAVIKADSFENYVTLSKFLEPNTTVQERIVLEKERLDKSPKIEYLGLEDLEGKQVLKLGAGNLYKARFKISLPQNDERDYSKLFVNFVSGVINDNELSDVAKDFVYIDRVELSANATLMKGRLYDSTTKKIDDSVGVDNRQFLNEVLQGTPFQDEIKWTQLTWYLNDIKTQVGEPLTSGQLFVNVYLQVKEGTLDGTQLKLSYNMLAEDEDEKQYRYPGDEKTAKTNSNSLFDKKQEIFLNVGDGQQVCDDKFCFQMSMLDINEDLRTSVSGEVPYISTVGKNYNMKFTLMNNNKVPLTNYRLVIENPQQNINMTQGVVYDVNNESNYIPEAKTFDDYFKYTYRAENNGKVLYENSTIKGDIDFTPVAQGSGSFKLTIIEDKVPIYSKEIFVNVVSNKDLNVSIDPTVIPSYVDTNIKFTITDATSGAFIDNAQVRIVDVYKKVLGETVSDGNGEAIIDLVPQSPNVDLRLLVFKEDYKEFEMKLKTNAKFISIEPEELKVEATLAEGKGKGELKLTNISKLPVKISSLELTGNFDEYVNLKEANDYLKNSSLNQIIDKEHSYNLPVVVNLTTIAESLQQNREYPAELVIKVIPENQTSKQNWEYKVPVQVYLNLGKGLDNLDCLGLDTLKSKMISTSGKNDQDSITVVNGCTVNSRPVPLINLDAKVTWKGSSLGSFVFNRNDNTARLQSAYYVTLNNKMLGQEEDNFVVDFSPINGRVSGASVAEINLRASYFTDSGIQFVEKKIEYAVDVVNMGACITYVFPNNEVDLISVPRDQKGSFTIKNECQNDIELKLKSLPDQFLDIRPLELTLPAKSEKQILIDPKASPVGVYMLEVTGKASKQHFEGVRAGAEALRVFIAPLADDCLVLDNYEFNLKNDLGEDVSRYTYLINKCYYKDIKAVYSVSVRSKTGCGSENFQGWLKGLTAAGTSAAAGAFLGSTVWGENCKWGIESCDTKGNPNNGTNTTKLKEGQVCLKDGQKVADQCDIGLTCDNATKKCIKDGSVKPSDVAKTNSKLANGQVCTNKDECVSGVCASAPGLDPSKLVCGGEAPKGVVPTNGTAAGDSCTYTIPGKAQQTMNKPSTNDNWVCDPIRGWEIPSAAATGTTQTVKTGGACTNALDCESGRCTGSVCVAK